MNEVFPNYYDNFNCIAGRCKHNCCIGWEIDIDDETMELYQSLDGALADKIRANIEGEPPHFVLKENGRCPFLNEQGLCDIILELGDGGICDICYLHPRFSHFYEDFTETGLGLCCEEAARLILTNEEPFSIEVPDAVKNTPFFQERSEAFAILQDRSVSVLQRFKTLAEKYGLTFAFSNAELYDLFISLERLDENWDKELEKLKEKTDTSVFEQKDLQVFFEQLACYFVFRHFEQGVWFTLLSCWALGTMLSSCITVEQGLEIVRMYSSEIEYSDENMETINRFKNKGGNKK